MPSVVLDVLATTVAVFSVGLLPPVVASVGVTSVVSSRRLSVC